MEPKDPEEEIEDPCAEEYGPSDDDLVRAYHAAVDRVRAAEGALMRSLCDFFGGTPPERPERGVQTSERG